MNILLVDDDPINRDYIGNYLCGLGHDITQCQDGREALEQYSRGRFPMVLTDIWMPNMSGMELLESIMASPQGKNTAVVLFTGYGDVRAAVQALRTGAYDYLLKPINREELAVITGRIAEHFDLQQEVRQLREQFHNEVEAAVKETKDELARLRRMVAESCGLGKVCFHSGKIRKLVELAQKFSTDRSISVLIEGETGTGKEVFARMVHFGWKEGAIVNSGQPFIDINCAAITSSLFESELFGYEPGAFTGSLGKGQKGKLDLAAGGTLFLDEISELPLDMQSKLLRVIQQREFYRVGGLRKVKTDARIICASNVDLAARVQEGKFRQDLYYRLKVGYLHIPPLRQRREDILPLASIFLQEFAAEKKKRFCRIARSAAEYLNAYQWPGNVRELRNMIELIVCLYDDEQLTETHLATVWEQQSSLSAMVKPTGGTAMLDPEKIILPNTGFVLKDYIHKIVYQALVKHQFNKSETARYLGISRRSLYYYLGHIEIT